LTDEHAKAKGDEQVIVSTIGKLLKHLGGDRRRALDLSGLRMLILDEADNFFMDETREKEVMELHKTF
jgi:ATP-dependent RNA helicase DDX19/DBP5